MTNEIKQRITQIQNGEVPEGYKKTKVGIVPNEWDIQKIDSILTKIGRKVDVKQDTLYQQIGIRSHGRGVFYKDLVSGESLGDKSVFWIEPNCLIVNIVFAWEQAVARTTDFEKGMIGSHRFPMYFPKENKSDIDYLVYFFMTKRGKLLLEDASPGGAGRNKTLGQKEFAQSKLTTPPLPEQEKIAEILTTQDKVIELKEKLIAEKEQQKKYLMQNLLTGKKRLKGFSGEWRKVKLEDYVFFQEGPGVRNSQYTKNGIKLLNVGNISKNKLELEKTDKYISEELAYGKYKHFLVDEGDLLIACSGIKAEYFNEKIAFVKKEHLPLCMNTSTMRFKVLNADNLNINYLNFAFQTKYLISQISGILTGSAQFNFGPSHIKYLQIYLPPLPEQKAIAEILSTADKEIELLKADLAEEKQKKKALMQLLLTGIVRV